MSKNLKVSELVKDVPERRVLLAEEVTSPKALKQESVCKEQQGGHSGCGEASQGEGRRRRG